MYMITCCEIVQKDIFQTEKGIHRTNSMIIPLCGEFEYSANGITKTVLPYEPVIFQKGISFKKKVIKPLNVIFIRFSEAVCNGSIWLEYDECDKIRLKNSITHLKNAIIKKSPLSVKEHFINDMFLTAKNKKSSHNAEENGIKPAYEYICGHYTEKITLTLLSQTARCSVQTLINKFRIYYGKTPVQYITELRMNKAKELLINTDFSVSQISEICGYDNVYYFSNTFKKLTGISPLKFRQSSIF